MQRRPSRSPLFPYTTLFRSHGLALLGLTDLEQTRIRGEPGHAEHTEVGGDRSEFRIDLAQVPGRLDRDRKSTRLNSSHVKISYAVFCLKKKKPNVMETTKKR